MWLIEPFDRIRHERGQFKCGQPMLDRFIRELVTQYEKRQLGRTFVLVRTNSPIVLGYYTLAASSLAFEVVPKSMAKHLPKHPIPTVLLARLAVDQSVQGQGLGADLLMNALQRSAALSQSLGVHFVEVDAIDEKARQFYQRYGFTPLVDQPLHLVMAMGTVLALG